MTGGYSASSLLESDRVAWTDALGGAIELPSSPQLELRDACHPSEILQMTPSGGTPWYPGSTEGEGPSSAPSSFCLFALFLLSCGSHLAASYPPQRDFQGRS